MSRRASSTAMGLPFMPCAAPAAPSSADLSGLAPHAHGRRQPRSMSARSEASCASRSAPIEHPLAPRDLTQLAAPFRVRSASPGSLPFMVANRARMPTQRPATTERRSAPACRPERASDVGTRRRSLAARKEERAAGARDDRRSARVAWKAAPPGSPLPRHKSSSVSRGSARRELGDRRHSGRGSQRPTDRVRRCWTPSLWHGHSFPHVNDLVLRGEERRFGAGQRGGVLAPAERVVCLLGPEPSPGDAHDAEVERRERQGPEL
jgi:hypothetical protein